MAGMKKRKGMKAKPQSRKRPPKGILGSGMAERAAEAIRKRRRRLRDI